MDGSNLQEWEIRFDLNGLDELCHVPSFVVGGPFLRVGMFIVHNSFISLMRRSFIIFKVSILKGLKLFKSKQHCSTIIKEAGPLLYVLIQIFN